jgi:hypothetical protein
MGRSIYCCTCKQEKGPKYLNDSRCLRCKLNASKKARAIKREKLGLLPWGEAKVICSACRKEKENPKLRFCYACTRRKDNEWRLKTGRTKRHRTGKCRCGNEFASWSNYQCLDCFRRKREEKRSDPNYKEHVFKDRVRSLTRMYISKGILIKGVCEVCGTNEKIEAHHDDYTKPMEVRWLCFYHHREHHNKTNLENIKNV